MDKHLAVEQADDIFEATFSSWKIRLKHLLGSYIRKAHGKQNPEFFWLPMSVEPLKPQQYTI